ncbi:Rnf26, partial [Symbiodinium microadriaticum]
RVEECENHLEMALSRARQYNNQMQKMQRRMDELQESLSYHRVAADRIRSLEGLLAEAERDRDEALDTQSSLERKLKRTQSLIQQQQQQQQRQQQQQQERELRDSTTRGGRDGRGRQFGRDDNEMRRSDEFDVRRTPRVVRELSSFSTDDWSTLSIEQLSKIEAYMSSLSSTVQDAKEIVFQRQAKEQDAQRRDETENALCCVCRDNNKTVLLLPCKHLCLCEVCSEHISTRRMTSCPVCRQAVSDALRVYI